VENSTSDVSTASSFCSAPEFTSLTDLGIVPPPSSPDAVHVPTFVASSDPGAEARHLRFLQALGRFLAVQLEHLKLVYESRRYQKKARKKAQKKARKKVKRTPLEDEEDMPDAGDGNGACRAPQTEAAETPGPSNTAPENKLPKGNKGMSPMLKKTAEDNTSHTQLAAIKLSR
jgi:hypothetical protein